MLGISTCEKGDNPWYFHISVVNICAWRCRYCLLSVFWMEIPRKNIPQNIWCIIPQHIRQYMVYIMWCNMKFFHVWRESLVSPQHHVFINLTPRLAVNGWGQGKWSGKSFAFFCVLPTETWWYCPGYLDFVEGDFLVEVTMVHHHVCLCIL